MGDTATTAATTRAPRTKQAIIDCDIHASIPLEGIKAYLPRIYREQIETWGKHLPAQNDMYLNGGTNGSMQEHKPPKSTGEDGYLHYMSQMHFDKYGISYGILTGSDYAVHTTPDTDYAAALCSASNDYVIERYLSRDSRLKGSIHIPKQDPILSAKEIDRVAGHPSMVQVIVSNGAERPYGHRRYEPIYEACVRHNLPFAIHVSMEGIGINNPPTGAGHVSYYAEYRAARTQIMMAHLASFIFEGIFVKYPTLKVVMVEAGMLWIAPYIWRLDQDWKALRHQTPWVKEPPSEYYRKHMRVTSQPLEMPPTSKKELFEPLLDSISARDNLMFASDYPHWDFDSPLLAFPKIDETMTSRIFYHNAAELYGLPPAPAADQAGGEPA